MSAITDILAMVQEILEYVKEAEAAGIIEIIKGYIETIMAGIPMSL